jgi:chaperonin cofactor prefoldin
MGLKIIQKQAEEIQQLREQLQQVTRERDHWKAMLKEIKECY